MKRFLLLFIFLAGCDNAPPVNPGQPEQVGKEIVKQVIPRNDPDHAEREKVRAWLRENTPTGEWEEIRWWDAVDVPRGQGKIHRMVRVKYRTENESGGMSVKDDFFILTGQVQVEEGNRGFLSKYFPD